MRWLEWCVGASFLIGLAWEESYYRQVTSTYRRSRWKQIEQIERARRARR